MSFTISPELRGYLDVIRDKFEHKIPYMYLDSTGIITVGYGHNLVFHQDLLSLKFFIVRLERKAPRGGDRGKPIAASRKIGFEATAEEKTNDYQFLKKHEGLKIYAPAHMAAYTTLEMLSGDMTTLFESDL